LREFAHHQRFDVWSRSFLIVEIRSNVSYVRIGETDNLASVTWIGENFLVTGEAGIKNDFAAAARDRTGRAAVKYAPVFQRKCCGSMLDFRQWSPLFLSSQS
jgi:hypothetical protein